MTSEHELSPYKVENRVLVLHDKPQDHNYFYDLDFHLENDDYLGTIAGMLGFVIEDYAKNDTDIQNEDPHLILLRKIKHDLAKLNKTHKIVSRDTHISKK
jgi:hypothetical protein